VGNKSGCKTGPKSPKAGEHDGKCQQSSNGQEEKGSPEEGGANGSTKRTTQLINLDGINAWRTLC
jgi:hypothetical protein